MGMKEALFGRPQRTTERGRLLDEVLHRRDYQACITPGCYAWWRYEDYIKQAQERLVEFRQNRK